jgi:alpha-tubulin suppressor-like RCC1 family protein
MRPHPVTVAVSGGHTTYVIDDDHTLWRSGHDTHHTHDEWVTDDVNSCNVIGIAAGLDHALAVDIDGNIWGTGSNYDAQLGQRAIHDRWAQLELPGGDGTATAVAAHNSHSFALDTRGYLWATGQNSNGQLGIRARVRDHTTVRGWKRTGPDNIREIATGSSTTAVITRDGTVWWCGGNRATPWTDTGITDAVSVAVTGPQRLTIVTADGHVTVHSVNGDGGPANIWTEPFDTAARVRHGRDSITGHTAVITRDKKLIISEKGWWNDQHRGTRYGVGWYDTGIADVDDVAEGRDYMLIVHTDGTLTGVGATTYGQLGHCGAPLPAPVRFPTDPDRWRLFCELRADGADAALAADVANRLI